MYKTNNYELNPCGHYIFYKPDMPKVEAIINELDQKCPQEIPEVSHPFESDIQRINEALKKQKNDRSYHAILRVILSQVKRKLAHKDYIKPLLEISLSQLQGKSFINDIKLRLCEAIIDSNQFHRANFVDLTVNTLTDLNIQNKSLRGRLQQVRAGKQYLKKDYVRAASYYLNASRQQAYVKNQQKKLQLINKAIAFAYIAPQCPQSHKIICMLCLNQITKKSNLKQILNKLYTQDMITVQEGNTIANILPKIMQQQDIDGVSVLSRAKFSHNMIPILNSFKSIYFDTLTRLLGMKINQVLILMEKTYYKGEVRIDQVQQLIEFNSGDQTNERVRTFLMRIDQILQGKQQN